MTPRETLVAQLKAMTSDELTAWCDERRELVCPIGLEDDDFILPEAPEQESIDIDWLTPWLGVAS
ncbi:MAG: hypothetical protein ABSD97_00175 [Acidimicrobiales bacterium]|jgi:hypothetical protein